jgi:hypothetical protein
MPTVFYFEAMRFYFYSNEESRIHIHVELSGKRTKILMDTLEVAKNNGFTEVQLRKIIKIARLNEKEIKTSWEEHFKKKTV